MQENVPPSFGRRMKKILEVMVPILITQLAITGMNLADTIMSGHAGTAELAGVAIGANIWMPIFTGLNGILQALTPIVANYRGAKAYEKISGAVFSGLMLALILSVSIISVGILQLDKVLSLMNLESSVEVVSHNYLSYVAMGIVPLIWSQYPALFCRYHGVYAAHHAAFSSYHAGQLLHELPFYLWKAGIAPYGRRWSGCGNGHYLLAALSVLFFFGYASGRLS